MKRRNSMNVAPEMSDVKIVLLGSTGSGKSAAGNTIIGGDRKTFKEDLSPEAVTRVCESAQTVLNGQSITAIDTVGLSDTSVKITDAQTQIEEMLQDIYDGVDVFLLVIKLGQTFTEMEIKVVKWIQDNFGAKLSDHTIVLFTHGDQLDEPVEGYLSKCESLRSVVDQCSGGFHVFNNKDEDPSQVTELLDKMNKLREKNGYRRYREQDYKETQDNLLLRKCGTGAAVGATVGVVAAAAAIVGVEGGLGAAASGGAAVGVGAAASKIGAIAITVGNAAVIGAAGGAALAAAVGAGVYLFARKYKSRGKDKSD